MPAKQQIRRGKIPGTRMRSKNKQDGWEIVSPLPLTVNNLTAGIDGKAIVNDVNFFAPAGSMTAIVGVNGAGKSTLLRALAAIVKPMAGTVCIGDCDITRLTARQRATLIAMVGQEEDPPGDLTVFEMTALGRIPHMAPWQAGGKEEKLAVRQALAQVGMSEFHDRLCGKLSGGQRRRALLARGLAQQTPVVVLDEPTNHLDVHHQLHLLDVLRKTGRTIVATIHDLDLAVAHFYQIIVVDDAQASAPGAPLEVLNVRTIRKVFDVEALIIKPKEAQNSHLVIDSL